MSFLNLYKYLLPTGRAFRITTDKFLRQLFNGLTGIPEDVKTFYDEIFFNIFPDTTTNIALWENQWGIIDYGQTDQQRIDRLNAAWSAVGGQSPRYLQDTLQAAGFDVYVYDSFEPGTTLILRDPNIIPIELLVNNILETNFEITSTSGDPTMFSGDPKALSGYFENFDFQKKEYVIPTDPDKYSCFVYVGGATFPNKANIPAEREEEFKTLCLKILPTHLWIGLLVNYV